MEINVKDGHSQCIKNQRKFVIRLHTHTQGFCMHFAYYAQCATQRLWEY